MEHALGRLPDPPDARDHPLSRYLAAAVLPTYFYATPYPPVLDQGQTPQCVVYSGSASRTIAERRDEGRTLRWDAQGWYTGCKAIDGAPGQEGTDIRSACKVANSTGVMVTVSPVAAEDGKFRKIAAYARLLSLDDIKQAIFTYGAAWLGSSWYNSWFDPIGGVLPTPDTVAGGHAYLAIGWSDTRKQLRIQNSWGTGWAQKGRAWLPYRYVDFNDFDCWRTIDVLGDLG